MRQRRSTTATGRAGEEAAARYLSALGYSILERNVRFRTGELDLVAEEDGILVFVEVKTRSGPGFGSAAEAVDIRKQRKLLQLAHLYLAGRGWSERSCRFDVVAVEAAPGGQWVCSVIRNAFGAS